MSSERISRKQVIKAMVLIPAAFAVESLIPPLRVNAEGGMATEENLPPPSQLKIFPIPKWLTERQYNHLDFNNNWEKIARISHQFDIDHRVLVAILLAESGNKIENGKGDGQGPFQICLPTKNELEQKYINGSKYKDILGKCRGEFSSLSIKDDFGYSAFLACVYLEKAKLPKGKASLNENYLENVWLAAVRYNQGLYLNKISSQARTYGDKVMQYLTLLLISNKEETPNPPPGMLLALPKN